MLMFSLFFEFFRGESLSSTILTDEYVEWIYIHVTRILTTRIINEYVKMIGLFSTLISLTYRELDKKVLGISNKNIMQWFFPKYNTFTLFHIISIAISFASSLNGQLEASCLSFILIIIGMIVQGDILMNFAILPKQHRHLAIQTYDNKLSEIITHNNINDVYDLLSQFAGSVDRTDMEDEECIREFIDMSDHLFSLHDFNNLNSKLDWMKHVWGHLFDGKKEIKKDMIPLKLFSGIANQKPKISVLNYCAFYLWLQDIECSNHSGIPSVAPKINENMLHEIFYYESIFQDNKILLISYALTAARMFLEGEIGFQESCGPFYMCIMKESVTKAELNSPEYNAMLDCLFDYDKSVACSDIWKLLYAIAS